MRFGPSEYEARGPGGDYVANPALSDAGVLTLDVSGLTPEIVGAGLPFELAHKSDAQVAGPGAAYVSSPSLSPSGKLTVTVSGLTPEIVGAGLPFDVHRVEAGLFAHDYPVKSGYKTPSFTQAEAVQALRAEDGTLFDRVVFGARRKLRAEFVLTGVPREHYHELLEYLTARVGSLIRVESAPGEEVFGRHQEEAYAYAWLAAPPRTLGEAAFNPDRRLYELALDLEYAGTSPAGVPNAAGSSLLDVIFEVDFVNADVVVADFAAVEAISSPRGGMLARTTETGKVYVYNASPSRVDGPGWDLYMTLPPDDPELGLRGGVFYWSAFADVPASAYAGGGYKAGLVLEGSIRLPNFSAVEAKDGPCVERPEGFSFSVRVDNGFHNFAQVHQVSFYNAVCRVGFVDAVNGVRTFLRTGVNNRNPFDYESHDFDVKPWLSAATEGFPSEKATRASEPTTASKWLGKPLQVTLGRWQRGALQPLAYGMEELTLATSGRYIAFSSYVHGDLALTLAVSPSAVGVALGLEGVEAYTPGARALWVSIVQQPDQPDVGKPRRVLSMIPASAGAEVQFTLAEGWVVAPNSTATFRLHVSTVDLLIDSRPCVGSRAGGYLVEGSVDGMDQPIEAYSKVGEELAQIPSRVLAESGDRNRITVDSASLDLDGADGIATDEIAECGLTALNPHAVIDAKVSGSPGFGVYDFGWTPDGIESAEVAFKPQEVLRNPVLCAAYSSDRTSLAWTPTPGATGYVISRYKYVPPAGSGALARPPENVLDTAFGASGFSSVGDVSVYIDTTPSNTEQLEYFYAVAPLGIAGPTLYSNRGRNRPVPVGAITLYAAFGDGQVSLCWTRQVDQSRVIIEVDEASGYLPVSGSPFDSGTKTTHVVDGLTNNLRHLVRIRIASGSYTGAGNTWALRNNDGTGAARIPQGVWTLKTPEQDGNEYQYAVFGPQISSAQPAQYGYPPREASWLTAKSGAENEGLPASGFVHAWLITPPAIADLDTAKEVRLLADFVVSSFANRFSGSTQTLPVKVSIQLRGLTEDGKTVFVIAHKDLTGYDSGEVALGGRLRFRNLPTSLGGQPADEFYKSDNSSPNTNGLYTGRDLWKLPAFLFENGAFEWARVKYLMFAVTNADPVEPAWFAPGGGGYHLYRGAHRDSLVSPFDSVHKHRYFIEVKREFAGGLSQPTFLRIDGGRIDDAAGTDTGRPGALIERARDVIHHIVREATGRLPRFGAGEFDYLLTWLWRYQSQESRSPSDVLQLLARNAFGIWTYTPDDNFMLRRLALPADASVVYTFNDGNIVRGSFRKVAVRRREEVYQRFRLKYGRDPVTQGYSDEMVVGYDEQAGTPVLEGYRDVVVGASGLPTEVGGDDGLPGLCLRSMRLYSQRGAVNEYGGAEGEQAFELFYRPVKTVSGGVVEMELPGLTDLWGPLVITPKAAMRGLVERVVRWYFAAGWEVRFDASLRVAIHDPAVQGLTSDGAPERRIKIGDVVRVVKHHHLFYEDGLGIVTAVDLQAFKRGTVGLTVFIPSPPGALGALIDGVWDAGAAGRRDATRKKFRSTIYGLNDEPDTYADAGAAGYRDTTTMTFPDGTRADPAGSGTGRV